MQEKLLRKVADLIKKLEGLRLEAYTDEGGIYTIGYGHTKAMGDPNPEEVKKITLKEAENILHQDIQVIYNDLEKNIPAKVFKLLTDGELVAIISFVFNLGLTAFYNSTLYKYILAGDKEKASREFRRWTKIKVNGKYKDSEGLIKRRNIEMEKFNEYDLGNLNEDSNLKKSIPHIIGSFGSSSMLIGLLNSVKGSHTLEIFIGLPLGLLIGFFGFKLLNIWMKKC